MCSPNYFDLSSAIIHLAKARELGPLLLLLLILELGIVLETLQDNIVQTGVFCVLQYRDLEYVYSRNFWVKDLIEKENLKRSERRWSEHCLRWSVILCNFLILFEIEFSTYLLILNTSSRFIKSEEGDIYSIRNQIFIDCILGLYFSTDKIRICFIFGYSFFFRK